MPHHFPPIEPGRSARQARNQHDSTCEAPDTGASCLDACNKHVYGERVQQGRTVSRFLLSVSFRSTDHLGFHFFGIARQSSFIALKQLTQPEYGLRIHLIACLA